MRYPGQVDAAIDLLIDAENSHLPTDRVMAKFFKARRYMGSKDKAVVSGLVYAVQRNRAALNYSCEHAGLRPTPRSLIIATLLRLENKTNEEIKEIFTSEHYAPKKLDKHELDNLKKLKGIKLERASAAVQANFPSALKADLQEAFGNQVIPEVKAMNERAPADVRVNLLKTTREELLKILQGYGMEAEFTPYSPWGIRVIGTNNLFGIQEFRDGYFEMQDEGSQLLSLLCNTKPSQTVVDYCAGAGGKTLGLAMQMENKGTIYACDIHSYRLEDLKKRTRRAGVHNVRIHTLDDDNRWQKKHARKADIVLVDAPCSGTGTWRRSPDMKWKMRPEDIDEILEVQKEVMDKASKLAKVGGHFVYATCSVLPKENTKQVEAFLAENPNFKLVPIDEYLPDDSAIKGKFTTDTLQLTPLQHSTDGFFAAVMERIS